MEDGVSLLWPHLDGRRFVGDFFFLCVGFSLIAVAFFTAAVDGDDVRRGGGGVMWGCLCTHDEGDGAGLPVACFLLPVACFFRKLHNVSFYLCFMFSFLIYLYGAT